MQDEITQSKPNLYPRPDEPGARIVACPGCKGTGDSPFPLILYDTDNNAHTQNEPCCTCKSCKYIWQYSCEHKNIDRKMAIRYNCIDEHFQQSEQMCARGDFWLFASVLNFFLGIFIYGIILGKILGMGPEIGLPLTFMPSLMCCFVAVLFHLRGVRVFDRNNINLTVRYYAPARTERAPRANEWKQDCQPSAQDTAENLLAEHDKQQTQQSG